MQVYFRVYYEDTDCGGIVYHSNYLKFCERARSELFFKNNSSPETKEGFFVVASIEAKFLSSAKLGDLIRIKTETLEIKNTSLVLRQRIFLHDDCNGIDEQEIFSMDVKLAFLDRAIKKPSRIPQYILEIINGSKD